MTGWRTETHKPPLSLTNGAWSVSFCRISPLLLLAGKRSRCSAAVAAVGSATTVAAEDVTERQGDQGVSRTVTSWTPAWPWSPVLDPLRKIRPAPDGCDLPTCHFAHGCAILMFTALEDKCCSTRMDDSATLERTVHSVHTAASARMCQTWKKRRRKNVKDKVLIWV